MGCLLAAIGLFFPRFVIILLVLTGDYIGRAYDTFIWPFLGFLVLPLTTLAYAWSINEYGGVRGLGVGAMILGLILDVSNSSLSGMGGHKAMRRRRRDED